MNTLVLFNPLSDNKRGASHAEELKALLSDRADALTLLDITAVGSWRELFSGLKPEDELILCGGDGTLNRFINDTEGLKLPCPVLYYAAGTGSDFARDIGLAPGSAPVPLSAYLSDLPSVTVKGRTLRFLNGVGYGIDGYCCEEGDKLRQKSDKPINYAGIAIKGLLFFYKPTRASVTVDGKTHEYSHVWLAPAMNGRFYGGGMMVAPGQDRLNADRTVSVVIMHCRSKLKTLAVFPSIFKGEHVRHDEMVAVHTGRRITVTFDRPAALQIDGETVTGVTEYSVASARAADLPANTQPTTAEK